MNIPRMNINHQVDRTLTRLRTAESRSPEASAELQHTEAFERKLEQSEGRNTRQLLHHSAERVKDALLEGAALGAAPISMLGFSTIAHGTTAGLLAVGGLVAAALVTAVTGRRVSDEAQFRQDVQHFSDGAVAERSPAARAANVAADGSVSGMTSPNQPLMMT